MRIIALLLLTNFLICNQILSQPTKHTYYFFDLESNLPIPNVVVSAKFQNIFGDSDNNGKCIFKSDIGLDSVEIFHVNYENIKVKLNDTDTIYLERKIHNIGLLNFRKPDLSDDIDCKMLSDLSAINCADYNNFHPNFYKGWVCFDKYIYNQLNLIGLSETVERKKIEILFNINLKGFIDSVVINSNINENDKEKLKEIFINSPIWIPICYNNVFYESLCKYAIRF